MMRVRPTLEPGHGAAQMRTEISTVINVLFSTTKTTTKKCAHVRDVTSA